MRVQFISAVIDILRLSAPATDTSPRLSAESSTRPAVAIGSHAVQSSLSPIRSCHESVHYRAAMLPPLNAAASRFFPAQF